MSRVVVAGGTGFIGGALVQRLMQAGYDVVVLSRSPGGSEARIVQWDGKSVGDWAKELDGAKAVVNLSGYPIESRWTEENRRKIRNSRVESTQAICQAIQVLDSPPEVWVNGSAVGFYGDTGERAVTEAGRPGEGFLTDVCKEWEGAATGCELPGTRVVIVRTGVALGEGGGLLATLGKFTKMFLGGQLGDGRQWVSWIHIEDYARLVQWAIESDFRGVLNGTAPNPVRNADLMAALREAYGRPWSPPVPEFALQAFGAIGGPDPSLALVSQRVLPQIPLSRGFEFEFPTLKDALADLVDDVPEAWRASEEAA